MQSNQHAIRTQNMKILPEVGSSLEYMGPIRARPKVPIDKDTYELCRNFLRHGRCDYFTGCKHAHSEEELKVWRQAQRVEEETRRRNRERRVQSSCSSKTQGASSYDIGSSRSSRNESNSASYQGGACRYPSFSGENKTIDKRKAELNSRISTRMGENDYMKSQYGEIDFIGIEDVIVNRPDHIEILCNQLLEQTLEDTEKPFKWVFRIKSSKPEILHGVVLYEHRNMFALGGVYKGVEKGRWGELKYPYIPNRICYQLHQEMDNETYIDFNLLFKPRIGNHQVNIVLEWMEGVLVARKVDVKVKGVEYKETSNYFRAKTQPTPKSHADTQGTLPVNWEQKYKLVNVLDLMNKHKMPENMEERIKTGFFDNINDKIVKVNYKTRFQTLLYLEEYEHRRSLVKYDLIDSRITLDTVVNRIINDYGEEMVETNESNYKYIKLNVKHQLFEGYRAFRPPKLAYIIPKYTKTAYECNCVSTDIDSITCLITIDIVNACEKSGGLAMVRFTPEREEYEKMHQALDDMKSLMDAVLFPALRQVPKPACWDEDRLLSILEDETLSTTQKEAVYSIINHKHRSFPTLICGPFGCGKTLTLATAAKLIALHFRGSRILIVAKTNSCANLYVELLSYYFDTMFEMSGRARRGILFRHFPITRNINWDKKLIRKFTVTKDGAYTSLYSNELEMCSVIVTTTFACSSLIHPKDRDTTNNLFTHIFIDEAAQLIEPETCIPLSLAGLVTKVVLAGDVRQSRPLILSKQGRRYNLDQSFLERLEMLPEYLSESLYKCKISLKDNFRSSVEIVHFLSELFYENCLRANPPTLEGPKNFPSLSFLHVKGEEKRLHGFPSFYNEEEAEITVLALKKFAQLGVQTKNMAVLTTYKSQVMLIYDYLSQEERHCRGQGRFRSKRHSCREKNCVNKRTIDVRNLEGIQGREYDLIIINTVRTTTHLPNVISLEEKLDLGLLDDVKQFNTILTRARGWVVVIGDSDCVTNVGECSNVWTKYVVACEGYKGFFNSFKEFETFEVRRSNTQNETKNKNGKPNDANRKSKISSLYRPCEGVAPHEGDSSNTYQTKLNSLNTVITACQQELTETHGNPEIATAIREQLTFARIALENLERQRYFVQAVSTKGQSSVHITQGTMSSCGTLEAAVFSEDYTNDTLYQTKLNSLNAVLRVCEQELTQVHANTQITTSLNDQITFANITLKNLERQRCLVQRAIQTDIKTSVPVQNRPSIPTVPGCKQPSALPKDKNPSPKQLTQPQQRKPFHQPPQHSYPDHKKPN